MNNWETAKLIAADDAYHGDKAGAASLGASAMFRNGPTTWKFPATRLSTLDQLEALPSVKAKTIGAVVIEPLVREAAGVKLWPAGLLQGVRRWCDRNGALLIADEVLTGFGRTGTMFASQRESVI